MVVLFPPGLIFTVEHKQHRIAAVVGPARPSPLERSMALVAGRVVAEEGFVLATGGLSGAMQAASKGAALAGGLVLGVLPYLDAKRANPYVHIVLPTGMGEMRNALLVRAAHVVISVGGGYGTLSEVAFALKFRVPLAGLLRPDWFPPYRELADGEELRAFLRELPGGAGE